MNLAIFSLELRNIFAYRVDFWVAFLGSLIAEMTIAFFLWTAIFAQTGQTELQGFTFHSIIFYYVLMSFMVRMTKGQEMGFLSTEIYQGTLNRYLVYPLSIFRYKYISHLSQTFVALLQLLLTTAIFLALFGTPEGVTLNFTNFAMSMIIIGISGYFYFNLSCCLEMVSFWTDQVWSLMVMLKFTTRFLGGALIPLSFFPVWSQEPMSYLPFQYLVGFPAEVVMGRVTFDQWATGVVVISIWAVVALWIRSRVWYNGTRQYTGIGI